MLPRVGSTLNLDSKLLHACLGWPRKHQNTSVRLIRAAWPHGIQIFPLIPAYRTLNGTNCWLIVSGANSLPEPLMSAGRAVDLVGRRMFCFAAATKRKNVLVTADWFKANWADWDSVVAMTWQLWHWGPAIIGQQNWTITAVAKHGWMGTEDGRARLVNSRVFTLGTLQRIRQCAGQRRGTSTAAKQRLE